MSMPLIMEQSVPGRRGYALPPSDVPSVNPAEALPHDQVRATPAQLPEIAEFDAIRHYTRLSQLNFSVDSHFYPLGSCTMKYNPKLNERVAALPGLARLHPFQPASQV